MIYAIGNSHSNFFTNSSPNKRDRVQNGLFISHPIGPVIAYNFYEHHYPKVLNILESQHLSKNDYIILVVGEMDCRVHLPKQILLQNSPVNEVVHECIDRFFRSYINLIQKEYNVICWGGHPTTNEEPNNSEDSPVIGKITLRSLISKSWDEYLNKKCKEYNIPYISVIPDLMNLDGTTKMEYFMDYCHLHTKYLPYVLNKFNNLI
jgi:hypothetical protein